MPQALMVLPWGPVILSWDEHGVTGLQLAILPGNRVDQREDPDPFGAIIQLREYCSGKRKQFNLPLIFNGTAFQLLVWQGLKQIPYGETRSYMELAVAIGRPRAARAVGNANHVNPLPIFIPCHRVIHADGGMGGYASGLKIKRLLLQIEKDGNCG